MGVQKQLTKDYQDFKNAIVNLLEAAKVPLFLQTSLKPVEVLSLCHISKEFQKKSQEL